MRTRLALYGSSPSSDDVAIPQPVPIQYRFLEYLTEDGIVTDSYVLWWNEDAPRCRLCSAAECTFQPTAAGVGSCKVRSSGPATRARKLFGG